MTVRLALKIGLALGLACGMVAGCFESSTPGFSYPPSWPIKELWVPPHSIQLKLPDGQGGTSDQLLKDGELLQEGTRFEHREWQVAFSCEASETELVNYFDGVLRLEHYQLLSPGVPK